MITEHASAESTPASGGHTTSLAAASPRSKPANSAQRGVLLLGLEVGAFSARLISLFGTEISWFVLPALLSVPIAAVLTLVYLVMNGDTNVQAASVVSSSNDRR